MHVWVRSIEDCGGIVGFRLRVCGLGAGTPKGRQLSARERSVRVSSLLNL